MRALLPELAPSLVFDWAPVSEWAQSTTHAEREPLALALGSAGATVRVTAAAELAPWIAPVRGRFVESWQDERARSIDVGLPDVGSVVAVFHGDDGVVLERTEDALLVCTIDLGLEKPPVELIERALSAEEDGGVRARAQEWIATTRAWDRVSAAALLGWLSREADGLDALRQWIAQCDRRHHVQLAALLLGEADGMASRLRRLGDQDIFRPYDESWQMAFHGCRRLRGRLAALSWWLAQVSDQEISQRITATLASLDQLGIDVLSESLDEGPEDPWLRSLHAVAPYSWWATAGQDDRGLELPEGWA